MSAHAVAVRISSFQQCFKDANEGKLWDQLVNAKSRHAQPELCSVTLSLSRYTLAAAYRSPHMQVGEVGEDWFSIYLIPETLRVTVLGTKQEGDTVNLEVEAQTQVGYCTAALHLYVTQLSLYEHGLTLILWAWRLV